MPARRKHFTGLSGSDERKRLVPMVETQAAFTRPATFGQRPTTPRLVEALTHLTIEDQQRIAYQCHITCGTHSKSQMIQGISHALRRQDFLQSLLEQLSRDEKRVLDHLLWSRAGYHVHREISQDLAARVLENAEWERVQEVLDSLAGFGLVIRQTDGAAQDVLYIPSDVADSLEALLKERTRRTLPAASEPVKPVPSLPFSLLENLFDLLCYIHKNEVRLTADRRPFKRAADRIRETLAHPTGDIFLPFAQERLQLPDQWELLYGYALRSGSVAEENARLEVKPAIDGWLLLPRPEMTRLFLDHVLAHHLTRDRVLSAGVAVMESVGPGEWIALDDLGRAVSGSVLLTPPPDYHLTGALEWLTGLLHSLGLIERGLLPENREAIRKTVLFGWITGDVMAEPPLDEPFQLAVQPNFEALIPSVISFHERWRLEQFADLVRRDVLLTYRISRESVYLHLQRGGSAESILSILREGSARPLPQNVEFSIREWSEAYGSVSFRDVILLESRTPQISREIEATKTIVPHLRGRVSETCLIVARERIDDVRQELARLGYLPDPVVRKL